MLYLVLWLDSNEGNLFALYNIVYNFISIYGSIYFLMSFFFSSENVS